MTTDKLRQVLERAKAEIFDLRKRNDILRARIGEGLDVTHDIQIELDRLVEADDPDGDGIIETGEAAFNSAPTKPPSS
ncbi:MAG: hypothetical protein OEM93_13150 [Rhodospirillales bacterium]|nr:hypothetical protein [Rhodospirillales bacterium]